MVKKEKVCYDKRVENNILFCMKGRKKLCKQIFVGGGQFKKFITFLDQNIKEMNGFLLIVLFILIAAVSGATSYAVFKTKVEGEKGLTLVVNNSFCIRNGFLKLSDCMLASENQSTTLESAKTMIEKKGTPDFSIIAPVSDTDTSSGLYATLDEDGTSYYYRGDVENNYVSYAGFIWRIVRRNGDGSVRLIYQGKNKDDRTSPIVTKYNVGYWDPAYVGYMYTKDFERKNGTVLSLYTSFSENVAYYFGTSYTFDSAAERFKLGGEMKSGTWEAMHLDAQNKYYYTCFGMSETDVCPVLFQIVGYESSKEARVYFISYSSKSYESATQNTTDSNVKLKLDSWYETNILNKKDENNKFYVDYLNDEIFCNDRSVTRGDGFNLAPTTYYGAYTRLNLNKKPSLKCLQVNDRFTVDVGKGNGGLRYPVGIITADEVAFAGGVHAQANEKYYLNFGDSYWSMGSAYFWSGHNAGMWAIDSEGALYGDGATAELGARPVLNLKKEVQIVSGNGTARHPYQVVLR